MIKVSSMTQSASEHIVLDHGVGGKMSGDLIRHVICGRLKDRHIGNMEDSTVLDIKAGRIAVTTDSFVIDPIFFHDGDIGKLAVCGTVNDLAVSGARPVYITLAFIIEEGFPIAHLEMIVDSIAETAQEAGIFVVAGDTKVVKKNEADKIYINTTGFGEFQNGDMRLCPGRIETDDRIIVTGQLGNHSIHILSLREGLGFENRVKSDCAPLNHMIRDVLDTYGPEIRFMRDITRGGLGTVLNEIVEETGHGIEIKESTLPLLRETVMAADMLGIDPIYLANEGNLCICVAPAAVDAVVDRLRLHSYGAAATAIGKVTAEFTDKVVMIDKHGRHKAVDPLIGAQLPRLC